MSKILFISFILISLNLYSEKMITKNDSGTNHGTATLLIEIDDFDNDRGVVRSHLFDRSSYFPTESDLAFKKVVGKIIGRKAILRYKNVPFGTYALTVHHDENNDGWMNKTWLGYPSEKFGLSNNPRIVFSVPGFDECKFKVDISEVVLRIKMKSAL